MANYAYLSAARVERWDPSWGTDAHEPGQRRIGSSVGVVPAIWLCLFTPEDLREVKSGAGGSIILPSAGLRTALSRIVASTPRLELAFDSRPSLVEHATAFADELDELEDDWVTIELEEIEHLWPSADSFRLALRRALAYLGGHADGDRHAVLELAGLKPSAVFPSLEALRDGKISHDQSVAYYRLVGVGTWNV